MPDGGLRDATDDPVGMRNDMIQIDDVARMPLTMARGGLGGPDDEAED